MKIAFLVLVIFTSDGIIKYEKIPFIISSLDPITCEERFEKAITYVENPNYTEDNNEVWVLIKYKDQNVIAHYCKDLRGNYVR